MELCNTEKGPSLVWDGRCLALLWLWRLIATCQPIPAYCPGLAATSTDCFICQGFVNGIEHCIIIREHTHVWSYDASNVIKEVAEDGWVWGTPAVVNWGWHDWGLPMIINFLCVRYDSNHNYTFISLKPLILSSSRDLNDTLINATLVSRLAILTSPHAENWSFGSMFRPEL